MKKVVVLFIAVAMMAAMMTPAFAADFTPSVTAKPAPTVVPQTGEDGNEYDAIIRDADGEEVIGVPNGSLIVTPVSKAESAIYASIRSRLNAAYRRIRSASSLRELNSQLEQTVKEISSDISADDLVVRDLFDVAMDGEYANYLANGNTLTVRFNLSADSALLLAVLSSQNGDDAEWSIVPNDDITRLEDYIVELKLKNLGVFAFLFDGSKLSVAANGPKSPQTGDPADSAGWLAAGGAAVLAAAVYFAGKKNAAKKA